MYKALIGSICQFPRCRYSHRASPLPAVLRALPGVSVPYKATGGRDGAHRRICIPSGGILRSAGPAVCAIPARPGAEPCKRWDIMDNKSRRKIVSLPGPLSSLPHAACRKRRPCDHEARSSCKYIGSLTSRGPRFILSRQWEEGRTAQLHRPGYFVKCSAITSQLRGGRGRFQCGLSQPPPNEGSSDCPGHSPKGLDGHQAGIL